MAGCDIRALTFRSLAESRCVHCLHHVRSSCPSGQCPVLVAAFLRVRQADGTEELAHFLVGPHAHESSHVTWIYDDHEWPNATVHFGRDPEGTPYAPEHVRTYNPPR
jgi:hypothetical protein